MNYRDTLHAIDDRRLLSHLDIPDEPKGAYAVPLPDLRAPGASSKSTATRRTSGTARSARRAGTS